LLFEPYYIDIPIPIFVISLYETNKLILMFFTNLVNLLLIAK